MSKLELHIGTYTINLLAPFQSIRLFAKGSNASRPFIVNTANFIEIPQANKFYIVEQDGIGGEWFAHDNHFINIVESEASFADTPQLALLNYINDEDERSNPNAK